MKIKTKDLIGPALDWAVAECEIVEPGRASGMPFLTEHRVYLEDFVPSCAWSQGGPIIERENIHLQKDDDDIYWWTKHSAYRPKKQAWINGPTPLIAAMRCYVASKLGDEVEVPDELMET